jgi:hypothetical protein
MDVRRGTLAAEGPLGNALPVLSVPASAMKKPASSRLGNARMSMIPQPSQGLSNAPNRAIVPSASGLDGGARRSTIMRGADGGLAGAVAGTGAAAAAAGVGMSGVRGDGGMYGKTPQSGRTMVSTR